MKRLIFAPGVCQIINAAAALDQDHGEAPASREDTLILFGANRAGDFARLMEETARRVWPWHSILWADDILLWYFPTRKYAPVAGLMLHERVAASADEIWISKLTMDCTKLILYAYPTGRAILYEDGAEEYIPHEICCGGARWRNLPVHHWPGALAREISHWNRRPECMQINAVCARDLRRIERMYSFIGRFIDVPDYLKKLPIHAVDTDVLSRRFLKLAEGCPVGTLQAPAWPADRPAVLFLPQPFATDFLDVEDEQALYHAAVEIIVERGYFLLWKEHPREITPLAPALERRFGGGKMMTLPSRQRIPVECLVGGWPLAGVVSVSSTSLFYLKALYGFPVYTAAGLIDDDKWKLRTDRRLAVMCKKNLPGLEALPHAAG